MMIETDWAIFCQICGGVRHSLFGAGPIGVQKCVLGPKQAHQPDIRLRKKRTRADVRWLGLIVPVFWRMLAAIRCTYRSISVHIMILVENR